MSTKNEQLPTWLEETKTTTEPPQPSKTGRNVAIALASGLAFGSYILASFVFKPINKGRGKGVILPYVPAEDAQVSNILRALSFVKKSNENPNQLHQPKITNLLDIGSGDGRICIAAAKQKPIGYQSTGIEINRPLVYYSKYKAFKNNLSPQNCNFKTQDLWKYNLAKYDNICIFGVEQMMPMLSKKFQEELLPGTRIVVCRFPLPEEFGVPDEIIGEGLDTVWLYFVK